jgi:class 3 adenylate cyclase
MFPKWLQQWLGAYFGYGHLSRDAVEYRTLALVLIGIIAWLDFLYNLAFYYFGYPFAWWTTLCYIVASAANFYRYHRLRDYRSFRNIQLILTILLPLFAQLTHGGFAGSSGVVLAAFIAPLSALTLASRRTARYFFFGYIFAVVLAGIFEYFYHPAYHTLPPGYNLLFFEFTYIFPVAVAYFLMENFLRNKATLQEELEEEHRLVDRLLNDILPHETAEELKENGVVKPKRYESVTVMFTDFLGFSSFARDMTAEELVAQLDYYFRAFDAVIQKHGLEKIKTIGDSYMCAGGLPVVNNSHAADVLRAALEIRDFVLSCHRGRVDVIRYPFDIRIGVHTGPVVAGVVGSSKFAYDIWGETVNIASRMEQTCEPNGINISEATYALVNDAFDCAYRGRFPAKHIGVVDMYLVYAARIDWEGRANVGVPAF